MDVSIYWFIWLFMSLMWFRVVSVENFDVAIPGECLGGKPAGTGQSILPLPGVTPRPTVEPVTGDDFTVDDESNETSDDESNETSDDKSNETDGDESNEATGNDSAETADDATLDGDCSDVYAPICACVGEGKCQTLNNECIFNQAVEKNGRKLTA